MCYKTLSPLCRTLAQDNVGQGEQRAAGVFGRLRLRAACWNPGPVAAAVCRVGSPRSWHGTSFVTPAGTVAAIGANWVRAVPLTCA